MKVSLQQEASMKQKEGKLKFSEFEDMKSVKE
jgi:hypothetical protein